MTDNVPTGTTASASTTIEVGKTVPAPNAIAKTQAPEGPHQACPRCGAAMRLLNFVSTWICDIDGYQTPAGSPEVRQS